MQTAGIQRLQGPKPGQALIRNLLFDALYEFVPKDPKARVQIYNYEIAPGGFTNWHIHTGATFYLTLQGLFEGPFEEGVLIKGKPGEVYSEPLGKSIVDITRTRKCPCWESVWP